MRFLVVLVLAAVFVGGCAVTQPQDTPRPRWRERDPATGATFYMYVPSTYSHDRPAPVIVSCHGTPPFDLASHHIDEWKMLGEDNGCIIVAPVLTGTDGVLGTGPVSAMLDNERIILSILSNLGYRYNIDRANIMITGFSGGGFPTYWVGLRSPDVFSCVVARNANFNRSNVDGWYPPQATDQAIMVYYGQFDPPTIRLQSAAAIRYLRSAGFSVAQASIPGAGHSRRPEVAMEFFRRNWRPSRPSLGPGNPPWRP